MNLAANLVASAARQDGKVALKLDDRGLSYRGLDAESARVAALVRRRGLEDGDRVGIMVPNVPEFAAVYYGVLRAGGVAVPVDVTLRRREVGRSMADAGARLLFAWHDCAEAAEAGANRADAECLFVTPGEFERLLAAVRPDLEMAERDPGDAAVILYASGTTGTPRAAELTHADLAHAALAVIGECALTEEDVQLAALPLFHAGGQTSVLNATLAAGGSLSLLIRFDAGEALRIMQADGVTVLHGVPAMYAAMLDHPAHGTFDLSHLRLCISGGAPLPAQVRRGFEEAFECTVLDACGYGETSAADRGLARGDREPRGLQRTSWTV